MMRTPIVVLCSAGILSTVVAVSQGISADAPAVADLTGMRLVEMFKAGYRRGPNSLNDARRIYESVRDDAKGDSRIDYAFGLVLLKQLRNKEAIAQFQLATQATESTFGPAWQALVWSHFVSKDYGAGYERLNEFAKRLGTDPTTELADRQRAAEWIGEVISGLHRAVETARQRATLQQQEQTLQQLLGPQLLPSYQSGKASVNSLYAAIESDVHQTREQTLLKQERDRADKQDFVVRELETSTEKRETIKKTAEELKKYLEEQLAGFDKQLGRLERDYDILQKRMQSLSVSQLQVSTEIALLTQQTSNAGGGGRQNALPPNLAQAYEQRKNALAVQLLAFQVEMDQTLGATLAVTQRAQIFVSQRIGAVQQYERATGQIVEQDQALNKWQDRLKKDAEKLKAPADGKSKALDNKVQQARSFRTYVDLDLALERDRLLDTFGVSMPEIADAIGP